MHDELSLAELEGELCAELPKRNLMGRRRLRFFRRSFRRFNEFSTCEFGHERFDTFGFGHERFNDFGRFDDGFGRFGGASAFASFGSAANANATFQENFNPQIGIGGFGSISSHNENFNFTSQVAAPINFDGF